MGTVEPSELARSKADSVVRAMEVIGEKWTVLILRQAFFGVRRFSQMHRNVGVSRNILAIRLQGLVTNGILERRQYRTNPDHYEYVLTTKGLDLYETIVAITRWGDKHFAGPEGLPLVLRHEPCGKPAEPQMVCGECGDRVTYRNIVPEPGPGAKLEPVPADRRRRSLSA